MSIDILVANNDASRQMKIQVKTARHKTKEWVLSEKAESQVQADLLSVFVCLNDGEQPSYHIVPSFEVADYLQRDHARWLAEPNRKGGIHQDNLLRKFRDPND